MNRPEIQIATVPQSQWLEALCLLFSDANERDRAAQALGVLESARRNEIDLGGLYGVKRSGTLVGVAWGQVSPGKTGIVWPPRLLKGQPPDVATTLLQSIDQHLQQAHVRIAQALLQTPQGPAAEQLRQGGYQHTAELLYLFCPTTNLVTAAHDAELNFEAYSYDQRDRLARLIEETYIETQDIPALNGVREIQDVIEGYERTGDFAPQLWLFVQAQGRDVGVLLLADHPRQNQFELIYMGLIPTARGRGWGAKLAGHAQQLTMAAGRERLVLAVDALNDPAIRAYTRVGFVEWFRRSVFLKVFSESPQT